MTTDCNNNHFSSHAESSTEQHCSLSQHHETDNSPIEAGIVQKETGVNGVFQEANLPEQPIVLHAKYGHCHSTVYTKGEWEYEESDLEVKTGCLGDFIGFYGVKVERIERDKITLAHKGST